MIKRLFDITATLVALVLLSPFFLLIALLVKIMHGAPVLFRQMRPGMRGRSFTIYKFRTMTDMRGRNGNLLSDAERLTSLGLFLRSTSLDELPELLNVLKGDMSLVGPRPLLMQYLDYYTPEQARRHEVRPGLTGWAQVNGRNALDWPTKLALDVWYVDHASPRVDAAILARTARAVFSRSGVAATDHPTMPEFLGDAPADGR